MPDLTGVLDYAGVATFATGSAIVSRRHESDFTATLLLALVAALGGGTIRDILIVRPVFWVANPLYVGSCIIAASFVWLVDLRERGSHGVAILEAIGIGCYAVVGAIKAEAAGHSFAVAIIIGAITATFGGIASDIMVGRETVLARKEIYVTAALLSACVYCVLAAIGLSLAWSATIGAANGAGLRLIAIRLGLAMPPPRRR